MTAQAVEVDGFRWQFDDSGSGPAVVMCHGVDHRSALPGAYRYLDIWKCPSEGNGYLDVLPEAVARMRGVRFLDGAGHLVQQERPAEVNELLVSFLRGP